MDSGLAEKGFGSGARLARELGVSEAAVSRWRDGKVMPEPERFTAIEEALGLESGVLREAAGLAPQDARPMIERVERLESEMSDVRALLERALELLPPSIRDDQ